MNDVIEFAELNPGDTFIYCNEDGIGDLCEKIKTTENVYEEQINAIGNFGMYYINSGELVTLVVKSSD